jgi:hypothetical protein
MKFNKKDFDKYQTNKCIDKDNMIIKVYDTVQ